MFDFTEDSLSDLLVNRLNIPQADASGMIPELIAMQPPIKAAFVQWWSSGVLPEEPVIEGYSALSLAVNHRLQPVAAFLTLDWLATEPAIAKQAISQGYDQVFPDGLT